MLHLGTTAGTAALTFGAQSLSTVSRNVTTVPSSVQAQNAVAVGAVAWGVDTYLPQQSLVMRSLAVAALTAGAMWAWRGDNTPMKAGVWAAVSGGSHWASHMVVDSLKMSIDMDGDGSNDM